MKNINYATEIRPDLVTVEAIQPGKISPAEFVRIEESLRVNGLAVVKNFIAQAQLMEMAQEAKQCVHPDFEAGGAWRLAIRSSVSPSANEFAHPFLVSKAAAKLVTNPAIVELVEKYINSKAIVHHSIFQESIPRHTSAVDWHVDTGSNKVLNGSKRFPDKRLRMIVYLSDVSAGGLSYLLGTREATEYFLNLPDNVSFPKHELPKLDEKRRITVNEKAGTVVFFDTHGLHKPDPPIDNRLVLNVWFARSDFSGALPPALVSLANLSEEEMQRAYIFKNGRGFRFGKREHSAKGKQSPIDKVRRFIKKII